MPLTRVLVRGIAGGITSGASYLGIAVESSILAPAGCAQPRPPAKRHTRSPAPAPAPYWTSRRRVNATRGSEMPDDSCACAICSLPAAPIRPPEGASIYLSDRSFRLSLTHGAHA